MADIFKPEVGSGAQEFPPQREIADIRARGYVPDRAAGIRLSQPRE